MEQQNIFFGKVIIAADIDNETMEKMQLIHSLCGHTCADEEFRQSRKRGAEDALNTARPSTMRRVLEQLHEAEGGNISGQDCVTCDRDYAACDPDCTACDPDCAACDPDCAACDPDCAACVSDFDCSGPDCNTCDGNFDRSGPDCNTCDQGFDPALRDDSDNRELSTYEQDYFTCDPEFDFFACPSSRACFTSDLRSVSPEQDCICCERDFDQFGHNCNHCDRDSVFCDRISEISGESCDTCDRSSDSSDVDWVSDDGEFASFDRDCGSFDGNFDSSDRDCDSPATDPTQMVVQAVVHHHSDCTSEEGKPLNLKQPNKEQDDSGFYKRDKQN